MLNKVAVTPLPYPCNASVCFTQESGRVEESGRRGREETNLWGLPTDSNQKEEKRRRGNPDGLVWNKQSKKYLNTHSHPPTTTTTTPKKGFLELEARAQ